MAEPTESYRVTARELTQFIERVERLMAEIAGLREDVSEVFAEAKGRGYDVKVMKKVIALRKRDPDDVAEEEAVLEMYKEALGIGGSVRDYLDQMASEEDEDDDALDLI